MTSNDWNRRDVLIGAAGLGLGSTAAWGAEKKMVLRKIPTTDEVLPVIGLGTYSVFDVAGTPEEIATRKRIIDMLTAAGGSVVDTSPMYNRSEQVIGEVIDAGSPRASLFLATKVWTDGRDAGAEQMRRSAELMNAGVIDLMQVHNLRDTAVHLQTIREWQDAGRIRYSGLTHYTAGAHAALEAAMRKEKPDFIQINYSLGEPGASDRLLPAAQDLGVAVLVNRPYQAGRLFRAVAGRDLPDWARAFAASWGQFFLKFVIGHPAVTAAIPATSNPRHMADNLEAGFEPLPDAVTRKRMVEFVRSL